MKIIESFLTKNPCYINNVKVKNGEMADSRYSNFQKGGCKGLMLHSVGCNQPSAMVFIKTWNPPANGREVCVHAFVDGNTGDVYQTLPWNFRGWHGGGTSNNTHIGVEMCEPSCIKYTKGSSFTCSDLAKAQEVTRRTYDSAVELFAFLCKKYNLNPLVDGVIISHNEGNKRGIATNHSDPEHLWNGLKMNYTMNGFRNDVNKAMKEAEKPVTPPQPDKPTTPISIKENDVVKLANGAKYYDNGKDIPNWVINTQWIVSSVKGDRVVIDKSVDGENSINSPVKASDLTVVKSANTAPNPKPNPPKTELEAGTELVLKDTPLYGASSSANKVGTKTGTYYVWNKTVINGRIRITNSVANVGKSGQVTGWIAEYDAKKSAGISSPITPPVQKPTTPPQKPATPSKPKPITYTKGQAVKLTNKALYASATTKRATTHKTGTYYIYDGVKVNGRYRITNSAKNCGKKPVWLYVTGFVEL